MDTRFTKATADIDAAYVLDQTPQSQIFGFFLMGCFQGRAPGPVTRLRAVDDVNAETDSLFQLGVL